MSSLSRCAIARETPKVLPPATLFKVILFFAVLLLFGLAHLSLRFHLNKLLVETGRLQSAQSTLSNEVKMLQGKSEALKHPKRLNEYGRLELGMVPYRKDEQKTIVQIRKDVYARYELARAALGAGHAPAAASDSPWIEKLSDRVGLINQALAGEKAEKTEKTEKR